ncbi:hypothetical protein GLV94_17715 [Virgibacillus halodenitrificans]|uniref:Uncharacterized protein n=1 Tax=Virgibacillus halodenitrificans TaxID=1482 RepID=A0ABR7VSB9_VIRHA|nr:hypothetical protein [Virgibacillus halodenitrificans]MBD1223462.1 hypothetical protein [Virgibacillus halodenitrificans]MCG1029182.1 hypothetical protein [Virgibacillus halodenitrificans]MYL47487.1 hypothetical protein [Virgibacillus halodenitrificans]MYL59076.1 hypothetical protein [Virgibacillus halodenitrificans]
MSERTIYFLFTDTGTYLAKAINYYTKQSLNHVSICFDSELREVYSFGRKQPRNPFIGGFVKEDIRSEFLKRSYCAIYSYTVSEQEYETVMLRIKEIEAKKADYKYNFIGLLAVLFQVEIDRKYALFCSQFVATVCGDAEKFVFDKPTCFVTPGDIRKLDGLKLIYQGKLENYTHAFKTERKLIPGSLPSTKQSFIINISKKVKKFVIR